MGSEKRLHNRNVGITDHPPHQPSQPSYKADLTSLFLATVFSPVPPGTTMDEVCLSKENVGRLRDLGFEKVATVVLLPSVRLEAATVAPCNVSILAQTTIVRAVGNFPKVSSNEV